MISIPPRRPCHRRGIRFQVAAWLHAVQVSFREKAVEAIRAGQNAEIGDPNPYNGQSLALAKCWQTGYRTMLTIRTAAMPARQHYLAARGAAERCTK